MLETSDVTSESPDRTVEETRPFRVKVGGSILTLLRLPNQRLLRSKLHQISVSGGLLNLEQPLAEMLRVELIFQVQDTAVRETVEMMFPMWATHGWLQPFRFVDMPQANRKLLEANLQALVLSTRGGVSEKARAIGA